MYISYNLSVFYLWQDYLQLNFHTIKIYILTHKNKDFGINVFKLEAPTQELQHLPAVPPQNTHNYR